ncbi:hypothetical protein LT493_01480 [Streptomyces tricolor]|nr:hypothetical protein [Streptomyces tricolor]
MPALPTPPPPPRPPSGLPAGPRRHPADRHRRGRHPAGRRPADPRRAVADARRTPPPRVLFQPGERSPAATLRRQFAEVAEGMVFIAENCTYVVRDGVELSADPLDRSVAAGVARTVRRLVADARTSAPWSAASGRRTSSWTDEAFLAEVRASTTSSTGSSRTSPPSRTT